ncbi:MAG: helix-turn-helix transcriptional regulator [Acidobacteriota bacterium]
MSQRQQLERILEIDRLIRAGRFPNADRLAERMEVSRRVVFKDRDFMIERLGAPIVYDRTHGGWAYSDPTFSLPSLMVTEGELLAFFLSVELARRYLGTPFEGPLRSAVEKVRGSLRGPVTVSLEDLSRHFTLAAPAAAPADERTLLDLHRAIVDRRRVAMRYFTASRRETSDRVVEPYHLVNQAGDWYLIAWDRKRRDFRTFHAGRIRSFKVLESEPFARRKDFDPSAWMRQAFQVQLGATTERVVLRFDADQAPYIRERVWHPTQQVSDAPGGGVDLSFETSGLGGVLRWVLQYGSHVEVLAPKSFKKAFAREVKAMARKVKAGKAEGN